MTSTNCRTNIACRREYQCGGSLQRYQGYSKYEIRFAYLLALLLCCASKKEFVNGYHTFTYFTRISSLRNPSQVFNQEYLGQHRARFHQQWPSRSLATSIKLFSAGASVSDVEQDDTTASSRNTPTKFIEMKSQLIRMCQKPKIDLTDLKSFVTEFEEVAEQYGIGQSSSISGLLNGEWELLYASTDVTRSSPFFWAFRKAFTDSTVDQIYDITDRIPSPIKDLGPAFQRIDYAYTGNGNNASGKFVSQVKVATLNGIASSIMTTRGTIIGLDGIDGIKIKIDTTKPEKSTLLSTLFGPLGDVFNENLPAFPSGDVLERFLPKSSEVILRTTYCDETIRISRNNERLNDEFFIFQRRQFASYDFL